MSSYEWQRKRPRLHELVFRNQAQLAEVLEQAEEGRLLGRVREGHAQRLLDELVVDEGQRNSTHTRHSLLLAQRGRVLLQGACGELTGRFKPICMLLVGRVNQALGEMVLLQDCCLVGSERALLLLKPNANTLALPFAQA